MEKAKENARRADDRRGVLGGTASPVMGADLSVLRGPAATFEVGFATVAGGTPGQIVEEKLRSGLAGPVNQFGLRRGLPQ
jgi:hypothetical protein